MLDRSMPAPSENAKNGIITGTAAPRNPRSWRSRLPSTIPTSSGRIAPSSACQGKAESPAAPSVSIVRNGPDSMLMIE